MESNVETARRIIASNTYMVLATSLEDIPWAAPVFFGVDDDYNFYFVSGKETRHAVHILGNPKVAIAIFDSREIPERADGVYIAGIATMVEDSDLQRVINLIYRKRFPDAKILSQHAHAAEDFLGIKPRRFFRVTPTNVYKLDKENTTEVDRRVEISLEAMRTKPSGVAR